jgi:hypothetical protein
VLSTRPLQLLDAAAVLPGHRVKLSNSARILDWPNLNWISRLRLLAARTSEHQPRVELIFRVPAGSITMCGWR